MRWWVTCALSVLVCLAGVAGTWWLMTSAIDAQFALADRSARK